MSDRVFRWYQQEAIENVQFSWAMHQRTMVRLGTGSGKTAMAAGVAKNEVELGGRVLFLGDSDELCIQPLRAMREFAGIIPTMEKSDRYAHLGSEIVIASEQTISKQKRLDRFPRDHFSVVICDEIHRSTERALGICEYFEKAKVLGLTATPYRKGLASMIKWFPDIAFDMPLKKKLGAPGLDLIEQGFAPPLKIMPVDITIDLEELDSLTKRGDYDPEALDTKIAPWYDEIADAINQSGKGHSIVCFLPLIKSSLEFVTILRGHGISAMHVDGTSPDRKEIIAEFERGGFQVICNSEVLSTGVDLPRADCLLDLSPTTSMARLEQRIGRVSRVLPGVVDDLPRQDQAEERRARIAASNKPYALIMDVLCNSDKMARPHAFIAENAQEAREIFEYAKKFRTPQEMDELARKFQADKEAKLIAAMEKAAAKRGKNMVSAEWVGNLLESPGLTAYSSIRATDMVAASEAQLNLLKTMGVDPETVQDKGHATYLISSLIPRSKARQSSLAQLLILRKMGVKHGQALSYKEASERISSKWKFKRALT